MVSVLPDPVAAIMTPSFPPCRAARCCACACRSGWKRGGMHRVKCSETAATSPGEAGERAGREAATPAHVGVVGATATPSAVGPEAARRGHVMGRLDPTIAGALLCVTPAVSVAGAAAVGRTAGARPPAVTTTLPPPPRLRT
eukprot:2400001-Prymnesium_polylepis.3